MTAAVSNQLSALAAFGHLSSAHKPVSRANDSATANAARGCSSATAAIGTISLASSQSNIRTILLSDSLLSSEASAGDMARLLAREGAVF